MNMLESDDYKNSRQKLMNSSCPLYVEMLDTPLQTRDSAGKEVLRYYNVPFIQYRDVY